MASECRTLQPMEYNREFLSKSVRPDGRKLDEFRPVLLNCRSIESSDGSALVKMGNSSIICGLKGQLVPPNDQSPADGVINATVDLPAGCALQYQKNTSNDDPAVITCSVNNIIKNSNCIDTRSLCIEEGKLVWSLEFEFICLDFDGNVIDACIAALLATVKCASLPVVKFNSESDDHYFTEDRMTVKLLKYPVSSTFVTVDDYVIADPTAEEELISSGSITIAIDADDDSLYLLEKQGGRPINDATLFDCMTKAKLRAKQIKKLVNDEK